MLITIIVSTTVEPSETLILFQQEAFWHAGREYLHCMIMPMPVLDTLHPKWWELLDCPAYSPVLPPVISMCLTMFES